MRPMVHPHFERPKIREITSTANPLLKIFRHALEEGITREGWLAIEGPRALEEGLAAASNVKVQSVLASETAAEKFRALLDRLPKETELTFVADGLFARVAGTPSPQGIAALVELKPQNLDAILRHRDVL